MKITFCGYHEPKETIFKILERLGVGTQ